MCERIFKMLDCCSYSKYCYNSGHQYTQLVKSEGSYAEGMSRNGLRKVQQGNISNLKDICHQCNIVILLTII